MEIKKTIYDTHLLFFIIFCVMAEFLVTGSLLWLGASLLAHHYNFLSEIVGYITSFALGGTALALMEYKKYITELHLKKEKFYKIKNIFNLSKKEKLNGVDFTKVEKEMDS